MMRDYGARALLVVSVLAFAAPGVSLGWPAFCTTFPSSPGAASLPSRPSAETGDATRAAAPDLRAESLHHLAAPKMREPSWTEIFARADALAQGNVKCPCANCDGF